MNNQNNANDFRGLIGRRISRPYHQSRGMNLQLFRVISSAVETPVVQIQSAAGDDKQFSFEDIAAMAWTSLIRAAVAAGKGFSRGYTIFSLEDFWNDSQAEATEYAAQIAQINVVRFVNDPICAALAYNLDEKAALRRGKRNVLVYNHGGNALDVSLLTIDEERVFCMRAIARDTHLGGDDFTNRLVNYFAAEFHRRHRIDLSAADAGNSLRRLRAACERAKRLLSWEIQATIQIDSLYDGIDFCVSITRPEFNRLNKDLFPKIYSTIDKCLIHAKITDKKDVHDVVVVGGSSKIPELQQLLQDYFKGKKLCKNIDPSVAVANAAHRYAHEVDCSIRGGNNIERVLGMEFLDFTRLEIRIETGDGYSTAMIPKNTTIPTKKERILSTYYDNQSSMLIRVYHNNNSGAIEYVISGILPAPRGVPQYKLCIDIDVDGTLSVCVDEKVIFRMTNYCPYLDQRMMGDVAEPADVAVVTSAEGLRTEEVEEMRKPKRQRF